MRRLFLLSLAVLPVLGIGACADTTRSTVTGPHISGSTNLEKQSIKATDDLIKFSRAVVAPDAPILVSTLADVSRVETSSPLGRMISEQIAGQLVRKGYRVTESKLRNSLNIKQGLSNQAEAGEFITSRDISALAETRNAAAAVIGTYADASDKVLVNLKLIEIASGRIVSSVDYTLDKTTDISTMLREDATTTGNFYGKSWAY